MKLIQYFRTFSAPKSSRNKTNSKKAAEKWSTETSGMLKRDVSY